MVIMGYLMVWIKVKVGGYRVGRMRLVFGIIVRLGVEYRREKLIVNCV